MKTQLSLTPEQEKKISTIWADADKRAEPIFESMKNQKREIYKTANEDIKKALNSDQQKKWDQLKEEMKQEWHESHEHE